MKSFGVLCGWLWDWSLTLLFVLWNVMLVFIFLKLLLVWKEGDCIIILCLTADSALVGLPLLRLLSIFTRFTASSDCSSSLGSSGIWFTLSYVSGAVTLLALLEGWENLLSSAWSFTYKIWFTEVDSSSCIFIEDMTLPLSEDLVTRCCSFSAALISLF